MKLADSCCAANEASKYSAILSGLLAETKRPHIVSTVPSYFLVTFTFVRTIVLPATTSLTIVVVSVPVPVF